MAPRGAVDRGLRRARSGDPRCRQRRKTVPPADQRKGWTFDVIKALDVSSVDGVGTVEANLKGFFSSIGLGNVPVVISSTAQVGGQTALDVVLSLNYSGPMGVDDKYGRMATAATAFLETFEGSDGAVRVGMVPFASNVLMKSDGRYLFDTYAGGILLGASYLACVSNRGYPSAVSIDTPTESLEASLWPAADFAEVSSGLSGDWAADSAGDWGDPPP